MLLLATLLLPLAPRSDDPTWARDVAPLLFRHCVTCHRPGEVAPFPLLTAEDAADHAEQIARACRLRFMPPWSAEPSEPPFIGARGLTEAEIALLERWAAVGAPAGDLATAPPPPRFTPGWQLGEPDLVVSMSEPFVVPADGVDLYRNFVIAVPIESLRYVRGFELRFDNARPVHHAVLKLDAGDSSRRLDARDPLPGFEEMETGEAISPDGQFLGWTPGRMPRLLPEGMAWRLPPGGDLVLQLHLVPTGKPEPLVASVGLHFTDTPITRLPFLMRLGSQALDIPPGAPDYEVVDRYTLPVQVELHSLVPHAHYLGRSVRVAAQLPDGSERTLVAIPNWDFAWQEEYRFERPLALPAGTTLDVRWRFDNSADNPRNPSRPPARVRFGPRSLEEMCDVWIQVLPSGRADFEALQRDYAKKELALLRAGFELQLACAPDDPAARLDLGLTLLQQGDASGAREELARSIALDPANARAHLQLGILLLRSQDRPGARACFERALALEPDHAVAMVELGRLALAEGAVAEAREWHVRAATARPRFFAARAGAALLLDDGGDDAAAVAHYEAALAIDPAANDVRRAYGWLRAASPVEAARDGLAAMELARVLLTAAPDGARELDLLAAAQAECKRFKAAAATAERAVAAARRSGDGALADAIEARRALYARSQPYRQAEGRSR
ncbi:MAG: tetratricopeptide repeat protein [Planctomycetes bacterium]|nr:tetratricopeptide repeat protein [Planctomycetota bacterium]